MPATFPRGLHDSEDSLTERLSTPEQNLAIFLELALEKGMTAYDGLTHVGFLTPQQKKDVLKIFIKRIDAAISLYTQKKSESVSCQNNWQTLAALKTRLEPWFRGGELPVQGANELIQALINFPVEDLEHFEFECDSWDQVAKIINELNQADNDAINSDHLKDSFCECLKLGQSIEPPIHLKLRYQPLTQTFCIRLAEGELNDFLMCYKKQPSSNKYWLDIVQSVHNSFILIGKNDVGQIKNVDTAKTYTRDELVRLLGNYFNLASLEAYIHKSGIANAAGILSIGEDGEPFFSELSYRLSWSPDNRQLYISACHFSESSHPRHIFLTVQRRGSELNLISSD